MILHIDEKNYSLFENLIPDFLTETIKTTWASPMTPTAVTVSLARKGLRTYLFNREVKIVSELAKRDGPERKFDVHQG